MPTTAQPTDASPTAHQDPGPLPLQSKRQWPAVLCAVIVFASLSLAAAVTSKGFLEADACVHYLYARFSPQEHSLLVDVWGRPFCTALYALPAAIGGRLGVQVTSMLLALAIALISLHIARRQGYRHPGLAAIFVLAQPILFLHSFSELTELPFAFLVAAAFAAYQGRQWLVMALLVGLMPTARPEGFGFILLGAMALLLHGRKRWLGMLALPVIAWSVAGWWIFGMAQPWYLKSLTWLPEQWPYSGDSAYEKGWLIHFIATLPAIVSPMAFPAVLLGVWLSLSGGSENRNRKPDASSVLRPLVSDPCVRCQWLIALLPLMVLVVHSLLYWRGKMASNGEPRYMLVVAPFWALLAARGWGWVFDRMRWKSALGWAGAAALLPLFINLFWPVVPLNRPEWPRVQEAADWQRQSPYRQDYPRLMAAHPSVFFCLDISPNSKRDSAEWIRGTIESPPEGITLIWDRKYGALNSDKARAVHATEIEAAGWVPVHVFPAPVPVPGRSAMDRIAQGLEKDRVGDWVVFLSPRDRHGNKTPRNLARELPADVIKAAEAAGVFPPSTRPKQ